MDFYDRYGTPVAYSEDGEHVFTYGGRAVAFISEDSVYAFTGAHLGWIDSGLVRDNNGHVVFFSEYARGGPLKPLRGLKPLKGLRQLKPLKGIKQFRPLRPLYSSSWSALSGEQFFG